MLLSRLESFRSVCSTTQLSNHELMRRSLRCNRSQACVTQSALRRSSRFAKCRCFAKSLFNYRRCNTLDPTVLKYHGSMMLPSGAGPRLPTGVPTVSLEPVHAHHFPFFVFLFVFSSKHATLRKIKMQTQHSIAQQTPNLIVYPNLKCKKTFSFFNSIIIGSRLNH